MKRLLTLVLVLGITTIGNASLQISVNGIVGPPDSSVFLYPSETASIDIWGDGRTPGGDFILGVAAGTPGSINASAAVIHYPGDAFVETIDDFWLAEDFGINNPFVYMWFWPGNLSGVLVDHITFHCEGRGDAVLVLYDLNLSLLDSQVIHQVPEPGTVCLLGLGGLAMIRRRRK